MERLRSVIQGKGANSCGICNIPATEYECCAVPCTQQWGTPSQCLNDKITVTMVVTSPGSCSAADGQNGFVQNAGDDKADCAATTTETACCVAQNCAWAWPLNGGWGACTGVSPNLSQSRSQVRGPARTVISA